MHTYRLAWIAAAVLASGPASADYQPDSNALVKELELMARTPERLTIVLWMPTEFWRASLEASGNLAPKAIEGFVREIDPYVVVAVADGATQLASVNFAEPELLKNSVTIEDARGNLLSPLPDSEVSQGVRNLTQAMRPIFGSMLGALGTHLALIIFKGVDKAGRRTVDPRRDGTFVVHVGTETMRYRLPLASLLPPAIDAKTGESFPGNYLFNPFTGDKLSVAAPDAPGPAQQAAPPPPAAPGSPKSP